MATNLASLIRQRGFTRLEDVSRRPGGPARSNLFRVLYGGSVTDAFVNQLAFALKVGAELVREVAMEDGLPFLTSGRGRRTRIRISHTNPKDAKGAEPTEPADPEKVTDERAEPVEVARVNGSRLVIRHRQEPVAIGEHIEHGGQRYEVKFVGDEDDGVGHFVRGKRVNP